VRLERVQIIGGALRVASGSEDETLVCLQHLKPWRDVGGMVFAHLRRDAEIGRREGRSQLGHQLFQEHWSAARCCQYLDALRNFIRCRSRMC
jgi:hypothetical protein